MSYCLPQEESKRLLAGIADGSFSPDKYAEQASTEARRNYVSQFVGEAEAKEVNTLMESKLLLKNWQQGMITGVKKLTGLTEDAKRDLVTRINNMKQLLSPADEKAFLADITSKRLGASSTLTLDELKSIATQSKEVGGLKTKADQIIKEKGLDIKAQTPEERATTAEYGVKLAVLKEYVESLKVPDTSIVGDFKEALKNPAKLPIFIGNLTKSIVASWDNSFFLNQGINALFDPKTTPKWFDAFKKSFEDIAKALGGADPVLGVKGEVYGRPLSINGAYEKAKLAIGLHTEEAIPTTIPEKIPGLGRFFKASNAAYNAAALRLRADIFDMKYAERVKNGIDMTSKDELESLGREVNAFTGRGDTGILTGENVNALVFSVKFAKSKFDVLTAHIFSSKMSPAGKKAAAYSLLRIMGTSVALMALSETLNPGSTEFDPRGTNFGKIKIGNRWYPTALSMGGIPTVLARTLIPTQHNGKWGLWMKNQQGVWKSLTLIDKGGFTVPKYGATTAKDIAEGYVEGKSSPIIRTILDAWNGQDFNGNRSTFANLGKNLIQPINVGNVVQTATDPNEPYKIFSIFMQALGSNTSVAVKKKP